MLVAIKKTDKESSKNCHRPKACSMRPVVFGLGGSAFCVMRTSLGTPRAGALFFAAAASHLDTQVNRFRASQRATPSASIRLARARRGGRVKHERRVWR